MPPAVFDSDDRYIPKEAETAKEVFLPPVAGS
jgi:hypothetical protein